ncbi:MAG: alginate O-acetyltransferase complex protein AlgI [Planctomycetota bacterium]|jgi:alginate O-acetyltransferase complex protein AlgI
MVFSSQFFLFYFLPLVLAGYYLTPWRGRNLFLSLVSYVFYGWWSPWFVGLMLFSTVVDWFCGIVITAPGASERRRRTGVATSIVTNLALLAFFKYFVFAQENLNRLLEAFGTEATPLWNIVLPVGISFYSFQSMSYSVDLYRGEAERARTFRDFACYVSMFPQLVAGPIVRYREIAEQLNDRPQRFELFHLGVLHFIIGFAKKVIIANSVGEVADLCFDGGAPSALVAWFGASAYAFQIYFDFSGYSDMAIGLGQMFGFQLPVNFRSPYRSQSITEFWRRWHISLSTWLRDYLYIPLGGNRGSAYRTYRNLALTMLLGGLWHGAAWTFIAWGAFHGSLLALERGIGKRAFWSGLPAFGRVAVTFAAVLISWVFFRAADLPAALHYLSAMFGAGEGGQASAVLEGRVFTAFYSFMVGLAALLVWRGFETTELVERARSSNRWSVALLAIFLLAILLMFSQAENPFLYFQF